MTTRVRSFISMYAKYMLNFSEYQSRYMLHVGDLKLNCGYKSTIYELHAMLLLHIVLHVFTLL